jgi:hypothetical protein
MKQKHILILFFLITNWVFSYSLAYSAGIEKFYGSCGGKLNLTGRWQNYDTTKGSIK